MTRDEKIKRIYEVIAERQIVYKEGCQAFSNDCGKKKEDGKYICSYCQRWGGQERKEEIYKPVMIGDVLDYESCLELIHSDHIVGIWERKREPIENQSDECIDYIYSLTF